MPHDEDHSSNIYTYLVNQQMHTKKKYDLSYTDIHVYVSVAFATIIGVLYKNGDKI